MGNKHHNGTSYSTRGDSSSSNNNNNIVFRGEECVAAMVRVGLSCAAHSSKDRFTVREALSKLHEIKKMFYWILKHCLKS